MDHDRKEGAKKEVSGSVKEGIGKVTGNKQTEAEVTAHPVGNLA